MAYPHPSPRELPLLQRRKEEKKQREGSKVAPEPPSYHVGYQAISRHEPRWPGPAPPPAPARRRCSVSTRTLSTCTAWGRVLREPLPWLPSLLLLPLPHALPRPPQEPRAQAARRLPLPLLSPAPPGAGAPESEPSLRLGVSTRTPPQHPLLGSQDPTTTPRKGKKKHPDSAARPLPSTSCGTQRCPGPAGPNGGTLCPQTPTVPGQM